MNFLSFNSTEEMQAYLIQSQADASMRLHPVQRAITYGDFWARFVDVANRHVEFGRVAEKHEIVEQEIEAGATKREAARTAIQSDLEQENGYLYGIAYSRYQRDGEWGYTHKFNVWSIEESLFHQAAEANWQIDLLPLSAKINLNIAFIARRAHVRSVR